MDEEVEVLPRYVEPIKTAAATTHIAQVTTATAGGLFTSMYENKLIVFIIVFVIIVIGVLAYIIFRKDVETPKQSKVPAQPVPVQTAAQPTAQPAPTPIDSTDSTEKANAAKPVPTKKELISLLAKSQPQPTSSKTEDEIIQLMEDETSNQPPTDAMIEQESDENPPADIQPVKQHTGEPLGTCNAIVQPGRQCKNKATIGGKCQRHLGAT